MCKPLRRLDLNPSGLHPRDRTKNHSSPKKLSQPKNRAKPLPKKVQRTFPPLNKGAESQNHGK